MTMLFLVRHGMTDTAGKALTGWTHGIHLNEAGRRQAEALVERFDGVRLDAVYSSPLERCRETAAPLARSRRLGVRVHRGLLETGYGDWTGRSLAQLRRTRLWRSVMRAPSSFRFPGGESLLEVQARAVAAVEEIAAQHPRGAVAIVSHADPLRLVLLHAAGANLEALHRWHVDPASISVVVRGPDDSIVLVKVNDTGELPALRRPAARSRRPKPPGQGTKRKVGG